MATSYCALLSKALLLSTIAVPLACGGESSQAADAAADAPDLVDADITPVASVCASTPGTRLTREFIEPVPGARQEYDVIDTELGEACNYFLEADGTFTCYPTSFETIIRFQDAACTSAIVGVPVGEVPKTFARARRLSDAACFLDRHFRRVGMPSAVTGGQAVFSQDTAGTCSPVTAPIRDYYLAGAELPITSFVTATRASYEPSARLSTGTYEGTDGSSMCDSGGLLLDSELAVDCLPGLGVDSELFCIPRSNSFADVFIDAGCTEQNSVVVVDRCVDEPPAYARTFETLECGAVGTSLQEVGTTPLAQRFDNSSGSCVADTSSNQFYPVGDSVPNSEFVSLAQVAEPGAARLTRNLLSDGGDFLSFQGSWHDSLIGGDCQFGAAADGSFRCLPIPLTTTLFFTEATCTTGIQLAEIDSCQGERAHFTESAPLGTRVLSSAPHSDPVFLRAGASCVPVSGSFLGPSFELAPSSFASATIDEF
tara:strand:+ start:55770 stop:57221 length:1452 start_codon:yes stop_codon:yes gene_type:complete